MMNKLLTLWLIIFVFGFTACQGDGISGTASGSSQKYQYTDESGVAEGSYTKITGTYPAEFEVSLYNDDYVNVELTAIVETGHLRVYLKDKGDTISEVSIAPGQSGIVKGRAKVWFDETFRVYFEAIDGEATTWPSPYLSKMRKSK